MTAAGVACTTCGTELSATAEFCNECGAPIRPTAKPAEYKQVTVLFAPGFESRAGGRYEWRAEERAGD